MTPARMAEIRSAYLDAVATAEQCDGVIPRPGAATPARCVLWRVPELREHIEAGMAGEVRAGKTRAELPTWQRIEEWLEDAT